MNLTLRSLAVGFACAFLFSGAAFAEKSMWQKFKDFFSPRESFDCSGPLCDEIHSLESKISKAEGKYSRERRPANKERYKKELDSLNVARDSLVAVYVSQHPELVMSSEISAPSSSSKLSSSSKMSSSSFAVSSALSSSIAPAVTEAAVPAPVAMACKPDTVYVRDTVVVHDTLFVVLANKPAEAAPAANAPESSSSENGSAGAKNP